VSTDALYIMLLRWCDYLMVADKRVAGVNDETVA
jgi:hypothetical protein